MIPLYTFDHALFLALNFDGGPVMDRLMTLVSGTAMWLPLYALILWLVWRREGWRRTLLFAAASEHISLTHRSFDRRVYATGAVRAALWAAGQTPGLYGMKDVLGIR